MTKLLQINVTANSGSTGKIAEDIGKLAQSIGFESWIAYGRGKPTSGSNLLRIGNDFDMRVHGVETRLFDLHGRGSILATRNFISKIRDIKPDIIHLHNIHGYYINYPILFKYLKEWGGPVVWTLHDCWPMTGHCTYFMLNDCEKWQTGCNKCPSLRLYPSSLILDRSKSNYNLKKKYFSSLGEKLTLVPVSNYVANYLKKSFFIGAKSEVIHNGIDLEIFKPCSPKKKLIIGVSNGWDYRKGLSDFFMLRDKLPSDYHIILVGLQDKQIKTLPRGIEGIKRTNSQHELAEIYSSATALINPTYEDNYPTVNLEAISCGTPVITYRTGGSPESITPQTGIVVEQGDINGLVNGISRIENEGFSVAECRKYAEQHFDKNTCFSKYISLYKNLLKI